MDERRAREIACWRYPPPYDIYNLAESEEAVAYALDPQNNFFAMEDEKGALVGFCSFGQDGQVPGGDYRLEALDIGLGIRPGLTGQGQGIDFVSCVLDFARKAFAPSRFRVTIAAFNRRAQRVWKRAGFRPVECFRHEENGQKFMVFLGENDSSF